MPSHDDRRRRSLFGAKEREVMPSSGGDRSTVVWPGASMGQWSKGERDRWRERIWMSAPNCCLQIAMAPLQPFATVPPRRFPYRKRPHSPGGGRARSHVIQSAGGALSSFRTKRVQGVRGPWRGRPELAARPGIAFEWRCALSCSWPLQLR